MIVFYTHYVSIGFILYTIYKIYNIFVGEIKDDFSNEFHRISTFIGMWPPLVLVFCSSTYHWYHRRKIEEQQMIKDFMEM